MGPPAQCAASASRSKPARCSACSGPNGAGKTTTVEIVEGHRLPTSGSVSVLGHDPGRGERALRDRIGVVLQESGIPQDLTVGELLEMHAPLVLALAAPSTS